MIDAAVFGAPVIGRCLVCGHTEPIDVTLLLKQASDPSQNGPWLVSKDGTWTRPADGGLVAAVI